jgi:hypothetical protein
VGWPLALFPPRMEWRDGKLVQLSDDELMDD